MFERIFDKQYSLLIGMITDKYKSSVNILLTITVHCLSWVHYDVYIPTIKYYHSLGVLVWLSCCNVKNTTTNILENKIKLEYVINLSQHHTSWLEDSSIIISSNLQFCPGLVSILPWRKILQCTEFSWIPTIMSGRRVSSVTVWQFVSKWKWI